MTWSHLRMLIQKQMQMLDLERQLNNNHNNNGTSNDVELVEEEEHHENGTGFEPTTSTASIINRVQSNNVPSLAEANGLNHASAPLIRFLNSNAQRFSRVVMDEEEEAAEEDTNRPAREPLSFAKVRTEQNRTEQNRTNTQTNNKQTPSYQTRNLSAKRSTQTTSGWQKSRTATSIAPLIVPLTRNRDRRFDGWLVQFVNTFVNSNVDSATDKLEDLEPKAIVQLRFLNSLDI